MKTRLGVVVLLVAACAGACGPAVPPPAAPPPPARESAPEALPAPVRKAAPAPPDADAWVHQPSGVAFPLRLGRMVRMEVTRYPDPRLGESVFYLSRPTGAFATVYLYTMGLDDLGPDIRSGAVRDELRRTIADIDATAAAGTYQRLQRLPPETVTLGARPGCIAAWHMGLAFELRGQPMLSHLYLTTYRRHFLKIRFSHPAATADASAQQLRGLLDGLAALLGCGAPAPP